ncbi:MAG: Rne/Rng family ribonuclease [Paludibacteraceae bacterium]|nr:Rne/Rng family ribonuclease [Paludibacteraceae bacterium]
MKSELIVDVQPDEITVALTEDGRLQEISREKRNEDTFSVGNIYFGRVRKVMPALNAAFVDVGHDKEAFLHYLDLGSSFLLMRQYLTQVVSDRRRIPSMPAVVTEAEVTKDGQISDVLQVGDMVLVQVLKEPINSKGPRLTGEISLAGRNMVLIPFANKVMVSQKIRREAERGRLRQLAQAITPSGFGVILRTVAEDKRAAELDNEMRILLRRWEETLLNLQQPAKGTTNNKHKDVEVRLISEEADRTIGIIRDVFSPEFEQIQVNDKTMYELVREYVELIAPESKKIVKYYKDEQPIFDHFDITRQMKTGLGRTVGFKNGGYLIIDRTEALFAIDVNSGSKKLFDDQEENAFQFNMLAADEIVHQLRLRDIGGIIIIDFIDMDSRDNQQKLYEHVRELMSRDRAKHNVLPLSKFGLMQITRQRVRPAVEINVTEVCPVCQGKGKVQPTILFPEEVENEIARYAESYGRGVRVELHPFVYAHVCRGWFSSLRWRWWRKYGVRVRENQSLGMLDMRFYDKKHNPLVLQTEPTKHKNLHTQDTDKKEADEQKVNQAVTVNKEVAAAPKAVSSTPKTATDETKKAAVALPSVEATPKKTETKTEKAAAKPQKAETKQPKAETKPQETKPRKEEAKPKKDTSVKKSAKKAEKKTTNTAKKPVADTPKEDDPNSEKSQAPTRRVIKKKKQTDDN